MNRQITVHGLTKQQLMLLEATVPEEYELEIAEYVTDLIVGNPVCTIIDAADMGKDSLRVLLAYYMDVGDRLDETVVWLGDTDLPKLPSFVQCDDFLQLLLNIKEIMRKAQDRYDIMAQYTDMYSYLPKHAIAECVEADFFASLKQRLPNFSLCEARKIWQGVLEQEEGPEFLAAICDLLRWLRRKNILFRMSHGYLWQIPVLVMTTVGGNPKAEEGFSFCFFKRDFQTVHNWLQHHWYFRNPDNRLHLDKIEGLETGLAALDMQLLGFLPGEVVLVGGRPAMGKTSFAKGVAEHVARTKNVLFIDLEECGCDHHPSIHGLTGCFPIEQIIHIMEKEKPDLLIIDRFQRIPEIMEDGCYQTIMGIIKRHAKKYQISVLVTTDLFRDIEERSYPVPGEEDIPAYSVISQFVDTVLLLCRPAYYDPELDRSLARIYIPKAKRISHPYCTVLLHWDDEKYRFTD